MQYDKIARWTPVSHSDVASAPSLEMKAAARQRRVKFTESGSEPRTPALMVNREARVMASSPESADQPAEEAHRLRVVCRFRPLTSVEDERERARSEVDGKPGKSPFMLSAHAVHESAHDFLGSRHYGRFDAVLSYPNHA